MTEKNCFNCGKRCPIEIPDCDMWEPISANIAQHDRFSTLEPVSGDAEKHEPRSTKYEEIAIKIGQLCDKKNAAYGNSHEKTGAFLMLLYPNGIQSRQYNDALTLVRIFDKQMRIATSKEAFNEDPWADITGYGLLGVGRNAT